MEEIQFKSAIGVNHTPQEVASAVLEFMKVDPDRAYAITIGTDSELYGKTSADFVTAIVIHRVGNGARYFWRRIKMQNFHTMRDRILQEVMTSLDTAKLILAQLKKLDTPEYSFEIHVDVGENGETKSMIQELVGMIRANDFEAKTKPESYAASSVADRHV